MKIVYAEICELDELLTFEVTQELSPTEKRQVTFLAPLNALSG